MRKPQRLQLLAALLAGSALLAAAPALAQDDWHHPTPHPAAPHAAPGPYHGAPFHGPAAFHGPGPHGFAPHGVTPRPGVHPLHAVITQHRDFAHFTPAERTAWIHGQWSHRWWNGRWGWWWFAGGSWFWYAAPIYPYPTVVSTEYYEQPDYSAPNSTWYYCYNPAGYYPYVPYCNGPWRPVPGAAPPGYGGYGGYDDDQSGPPQGDYGPQGQYQGDEEGPPPQNGYGPPQNGYGPPPGQQGPYGQDGPPPGYNQGPPPGDDQGPPPPQQ
jgi:hypothetical protein